MDLRTLNSPSTECFLHITRSWGVVAGRQFGKEGAKLLVVRNIVNEVQGFITRTFVADENTLFR